MTNFAKGSYPPIRITSAAKTHLDAVLEDLKRRKIPGVSGSRLVSELILSREIPGLAAEETPEVGVDFCPACDMTLPVDGDVCLSCGASIIHMTAISTVELIRLRSLAGRTTRLEA